MSSYIWSLESGTIPPGLTLSLADTDLDITLSGTPTTAGVYDFTIRITNNVSSDFDDQAFQVTIGDLAVDITPDLGTDINMQFDVAQNPFLVSVDSDQMTLDSSLQSGLKYMTLRRVVLEVDFGLGADTYWFNLSSIRPGLPTNRWYLFRINSDPEAISRAYII